MKTTLAVTVLVLLAVLLFPPADRVAQVKPGLEFRENAGFNFIGNVGGSVQIRYLQWTVQIVGVILLGGIAGVAVKMSQGQPADRAPIG